MATADFIRENNTSIYPVTRGRIFVFGSNNVGRHGAGAAKQALVEFGARYGVGRGLQGQSYAIATKYQENGPQKFLKSYPLEDIELNVNTFIKFARQHPELDFHVTKVGCGLAGYKDSQIAPLFTGAPVNCYFHPDWHSYGLKSYDEV